MKKKILIVVLIFVLSTPIYAEALPDISNEDGGIVLSPDDYLSDEIKEILKNNGIDNFKTPDTTKLVYSLIQYLIQGVKEYSSFFVMIIALIISVSIIKRFNDNGSALVILNYVFELVLASQVVYVFYELLSENNDLLISVKELLFAMLPSFTAVTLISGAGVTASFSAAAFGALISFLEVFAGGALSALVVFLVVTSVFERVSPPFATMGLSKSIKKYSLTLIAFLTTAMITVISFQNVLSSKADSVSVRSVKFAASSFIPIIGSAVGEALKTVSSGVEYVKATVGYASALALFFVIFPIICKLVSVKLMFSFAAFFSNICSTEKDGSVLASFSSIIDILLSVIICVTILSFLLIYLFSTTAFNYIR